MLWFSRLLIRALGAPLYLRIPRRVRSRLGMVCGDDFADINATLAAMRVACPVASAGGTTPASTRHGE